MTITTNLKYSWRIKHGKTNAVIRDFGEATGAIDFEDGKLTLIGPDQLDAKSVQDMVTGLKQALCAQVIDLITDDAGLKEAITMIGWKPDVYRLEILSIEQS